MAKELNPDKYVDLFKPLKNEADKIAKSAEEEMIKLLKENPKGSCIILPEDNQIDFLFDRDGYYATFLAFKSSSRRPCQALVIHLPAKGRPRIALDDFRANPSRKRSYAAKIRKGFHPKNIFRA